MFTFPTIFAPSRGYKAIMPNRIPALCFPCLLIVMPHPPSYQKLHFLFLYLRTWYYFDIVVVEDFMFSM